MSVQKGTEVRPDQPALADPSPSCTAAGPAFDQSAFVASGRPLTMGGFVLEVTRRYAANEALVFDDPLSRPSSDDTDHGWGEPSGDGGDSAADLKRFLDEKPPHHI